MFVSPAWNLADLLTLLKKNRKWLLWFGPYPTVESKNKISKHSQNNKCAIYFWVFSLLTFLRRSKSGNPTPIKSYGVGIVSRWLKTLGSNSACGAVENYPIRVRETNRSLKNDVQKRKLNKPTSVSGFCRPRLRRTGFTRPRHGTWWSNQKVSCYPVLSMTLFTFFFFWFQ